MYEFQVVKVIELDCVRGFMKLTPVTRLHSQPQGGIISLWKINHSTKHVHSSTTVTNKQMHSNTAFNYYLQH